jgi:hypothetical protein
LVRGVHSKTFTIGDIVAHNIPLNSLGQILGYFDTLLEKPVRPLLEEATDRWAIEIGQKIAGPIRAAGNTEYADELEDMAKGPRF